MTSRKRPTSPGGNSQRFATVPQGPDGTRIKIPQAKDSLTLIYVTDDRNWPERPTMLLAYNETELREGAVVEMEELRPGHGMGSMTALRVLEVRLRLERWTGTYGRVQRFVLCIRVDNEEAVEAWVGHSLTAEDL
jgi:hypothetical protein